MWIALSDTPLVFSCLGSLIYNVFLWIPLFYHSRLFVSLICSVISQLKSFFFLFLYNITSYYSYKRVMGLQHVERTSLSIAMNFILSQNNKRVGSFFKEDMCCLAPWSSIHHILRGVIKLRQCCHIE